MTRLPLLLVLGVGIGSFAFACNSEKGCEPRTRVGTWGILVDSLEGYVDEDNNLLHECEVYCETDSTIYSCEFFRVVPEIGAGGMGGGSGWWLYSNCEYDATDICE